MKYERVETVYIIEAENEEMALRMVQNEEYDTDNFFDQYSTEGGIGFIEEYT